MSPSVLNTPQPRGRPRRQRGGLPSPIHLLVLGVLVWDLRASAKGDGCSADPASLATAVQGALLPSCVSLVADPRELCTANIHLDVGQAPSVAVVSPGRVSVAQPPREAVL